MRRPEQQLQTAVANYLRLVLRSPTLWTAIGHGGGGKVRGAILKGMGVQPGWPDILVMRLGTPGQTLVVGIELKAKKGSLSPEQKAMRAAFKEAGANYAVCRSIDEVAEALRIGCIPLHDSRIKWRTT